MNKIPNEVVVLMNTALYLNLYKTDWSYSNLFDSLMDKAEKNKVLLEYTFEQVKQNMFDREPISYQIKELKRLFLLTSISQEFNNSLQQELKCLNY